MFSWVGKLFGSDKAASSLIDNISSGLDKLHYGDQERAGDNAKSVTEARQVLLQWLQSTSGSNLARRFIAITVTCIWSLQYIVSMVLLALLPWLPEYAEVMKVSAVSLQGSGEAISGAMMLVLGFYFAAPHLGSIVDKAMSKFDKPKKTT